MSYVYVSAVSLAGGVFLLYAYQNLDAANAAPPASDKERKSALGWIALIAVLGVIALVIAGVYSYKAHKAEVAKIESAPVALPELVKPTIVKRIAKKIAPQAVNTPPIVEFDSTVQKPTEPLSQFEIDVIAFETKVKKDFP
jgi:hypothetical protein